MTDAPAQVIIRGRNAEDWKAIAAICRAQPPEFNPLEIPYASDDYIHSEFGAAPDNHWTFGLVAEVGSVVGGVIGIRRGWGRLRHSATIEHFVVDPVYQEQGVGGTLLGALVDLAEGWLNLSRLDTTIPTDNAPGITLYRKYGFVIEGKLRDYVYHDGRYLDAYVMARVRDAF